MSLYTWDCLVQIFLFIRHSVSRVNDACCGVVVSHRLRVRLHANHAPPSPLHADAVSPAKCQPVRRSCAHLCENVEHADAGNAGADERVFSAATAQPVARLLAPALDRIQRHRVSGFVVG